MLIAIVFATFCLVNLLVYFATGNILSLFLAGMFFTAFGQRIVGWWEVRS